MLKKILEDKNCYHFCVFCKSNNFVKISQIDLQSILLYREEDNCYHSFLIENFSYEVDSRHNGFYIHYYIKTTNDDDFAYYLGEDFDIVSMKAIVLDENCKAYIQFQICLEIGNFEQHSFLIIPEISEVLIEVEELQKKYNNLKKSKMTKQDICDIAIPFRDKWKLKDSDVLGIIRNEFTFSKVLELLSD